MSDSKHKLEVSFSTTASGRLSCEIYYAVPNIMFEIEKILIAKFGCTKMETPLQGPDQVITSCKKGDMKLEIGWDNWSGFYIFADSKDGDQLIRELGEYLRPLIKGKEYEKFIHDW